MFAINAVIVPVIKLLSKGKKEGEKLSVFKGVQLLITYSYSIVAGGLLVISNSTLFT
jgi:hypothetical protein